MANNLAVLSGRKSYRRAGAFHKSEVRWGIFLASPAVIGFLVFTLGPMIASLIFSFTDYMVVNTPKFIGFENYVSMFNGTDPFFYKSLAVTAYYVALSVPASILFAFLTALLLNSKVRCLSVFRTIFYLPSLVPLVASSMIWLWILNPDMGLANNLLRALKLPTGQWIYAENTVIPSLVLISLWMTGNTVVIFLAGLQGIPQHLYEAIEIDGGNSVHKLVNITVPIMTPTIFYNLIIGFIGSFQSFAQAYIMTQGGPNNQSLFYVFYLYREAFTNARMGFGCAAGWVLFIIIGILTAFVFKSSKSWVYYEGGG